MAATSREVALTAGAVLGSICLLSLLAGVLFDVKPLIVRSGSMQPAIATGALALSRTVSAHDLAVGDIVSVKTLDGTRVTHRVVEIQHQEDVSLLTLKGDANGSVDDEVYSVASAERVVLDVPYLGYVVSWTSGRTGVFLGGLAAGGLLILAFRRPAGGDPQDPPDRPEPPARGKHVLGVTVLVAAIGLGGQLGVRTQDTWASWTDSGALSGLGATSYTVPTPALTCAVAGSGKKRTITFQWTAVTSPPTTYTASVETLFEPTITMTGTTLRTLTVSYDPGEVANHNQTVTVAVTPTLSDVPSWNGPAGTREFTTPGNKNFDPVCVA